MKQLLNLLFVLLPLCWISCSKSNHIDYDPWYPTHVFPGNLTVAPANLDTVTPPFNPLHPLSPAQDTLPAYYGFLDNELNWLAQRSCALYGLGEAHNRYLLVDNAWNPIRYNHPLLANCHEHQLLYIRGLITIRKNGRSNYLLLQPADIQTTDSILPDSLYYNYIH